MPDGAGGPRTFHIRTFGCQMNEHDSERIAALLAAEGMVRAATAEDADLVVLNTCTIRENADNKLYGTLGHLKAEKQRRPDMQIAVGGCMAQRDGAAIAERAPFVDAVWGTHNITSAAALLAQAKQEGRTAIEILDGPPPTSADDQAEHLASVREVPWSAWVTIQVGLRQQLRLLHRA